MNPLQNRCRLCLTQNSTLISIFDSEKNISEELSTCLSINITPEDKLPKYICSKCANTLHKYYTFHTNAKHSEELLFAFLNDSSSLKKKAKIDNDKLNIKNLDMDFSTDTIFLTDLLDGSDDFDSKFLADDSTTFSTLQYLDGEESGSDDIAQALLQNGAKLTKIANVVKKNAPDSASDSYEIHMEMDVLDSDLEIVNEILSKESQKTDQSIPESYACMSCKSAFSNFDLLIKHMETCDSLKKTCPDCGKRFKTNTQMKKHLNIHKVENCTHCEKSFADTEALNSHVQNDHIDRSDNVECIFRCKKCGVVFKTKSELYGHVKFHIKSKHQDKKGHFSCDDCDASYFNLSHLQNHRKIKHNDVDNRKVYRCKVCSTLFVDKNKLYAHIKLHTDVLGDGLHLCDTCGMSFNRAKALSQHVQMHKVNSLKCDVCSKLFVSEDSLKSHTIVHDAENQMCELCGLSLADEHSLGIHKMTDHSTDVL